MPMKSRLLFLFFVGALVALTTGPGYAAYEAKVSEYEKAVFAYFKLARTMPHFDAWIRSSENYKSLPAPQQEPFYEQEAMRLKWGFGTYDETAQFLRIGMAVEIMLVADPKAPSLRFRHLNSADENLPYFPYPYGGEWVALVVNDLEYFKNVPLGPKQLEAITGHIKPGHPYRADIRMRVRPLSADTEKPLVIDDVNYWLMMGDVAFFEFSLPAAPGAKPVSLWSYTAPWYLSESEEELIHLLEQR